MHTVISRELEVLGSHGLAAHDYPELLDLVSSGRLRPDHLVTRTISLDEVPAAFASGQICLQSTTEVGFVDGVIELLVDSSSCEPADAYCSPTCEFEAGTTKELVDPLALIGG